MFYADGTVFRAELRVNILVKLLSAACLYYRRIQVSKRAPLAIYNAATPGSMVYQVAGVQVVVDQVARVQVMDQVTGAQVLDQVTGAQMLDQVTGAQVLNQVAGAQMLDQVAVVQVVVNRVAGTQGVDQVTGVQVVGQY